MELNTPKNDKPLSYWIDKYESYPIETREAAWDYANAKHHGIWDKATEDLKRHPEQYEIVFNMFCHWIEEYQAAERVKKFLGTKN